MAGDWIKMRGNLWDDPRVARLVDKTDSSEAAIVGALYWLWSTADQHTENGFMPGLTCKSIDRKTGVKGFSDALISINWIEDGDDGVTIVDFEKHNGASAKKRCQTAKRVANHAAKNANPTENTGNANADFDEANADSVSSALAREREEKIVIPSLSESAIPTDPVDQVQNSVSGKPESKKQPVPPCPFDAVIDAYEAALPNLPSVTRSLFCDGVNGKATAQRWAWVMTAIHEKGPRKGERLAVTQQEGVDWFTRFFAYAAISDFLTGANGKFTGCSLGWLVTKSNFEKVLAGNYHMEKAA